MSVKKANQLAAAFAKAGAKGKASKPPGEEKPPKGCPTCGQPVPDAHPMPPAKVADLKSSDQD